MSDKHAKRRARIKSDATQYAAFKLKDAIRKREARRRMAEKHATEDAGCSTQTQRPIQSTQDHVISENFNQAYSTPGSTPAHTSPPPDEDDIEVPHDEHQVPFDDFFKDPQAIDNYLGGWRESSEPNAYLARLRLKVGFWREDLGQSVDAWPMRLDRHLKKAEKKGRVDKFVRGLCIDVQVGKFLLGELAGLWRLRLPRDENSLSDLWLQASIIQEGIHARIATLRSFI